MPTPKQIGVSMSEYLLHGLAHIEFNAMNLYLYVPVHCALKHIYFALSSCFLQLSHKRACYLVLVEILSSDSATMDYLTNF